MTKKTFPSRTWPAVDVARSLGIEKPVQILEYCLDIGDQEKLVKVFFISKFTDENIELDKNGCLNIGRRGGIFSYSCPLEVRLNNYPLRPINEETGKYYDSDEQYQARIDAYEDRYGEPQEVRLQDLFITETDFRKLKSDIQNQNDRQKHYKSRKAKGLGGVNFIRDMLGKHWLDSSGVDIYCLTNKGLSKELLTYYKNLSDHDLEKILESINPTENFADSIQEARKKINRLFTSGVADWISRHNTIGIKNRRVGRPKNQD